MRWSVGFVILLVAFIAVSPARAGAIERVELYQRQEVILEHQRFVGNLRAQAGREGVIVKVPQLFIYFTDRTPAWHLHGHRRGFGRELSLIWENRRRERSMVELDRLLERAVAPDGGEITLEDLPRGDIHVVLYREADCEDCRRVEETMHEWLDARDLDAVWLDVWMDRRPSD
jgi:hypothetical protein